MGLLNAAMDPEFRSDIGRGLLDAGNRGIFAGLLGGPVDLAAMVMRPLGYNHAQPTMGSAWIDRKLQDTGVVSGNRNPLAETLAGLAGPGAMVKGARGLALLADVAPELAASRGSYGSLMGQFGAISPEGKARLLADLQAGKPSGTYRLGDVTQGQANGLQRLGFPRGESRDVVMTDDAFNHLMQSRMARDNYTPEDIVRFAAQAMEKRSNADLNVSKAGQYPSLLNPGQRDPLTGNVYDARMPLKSGEQGYEVRSVVPEGLRGRNNKAPKR